MNALGPPEMRLILAVTDAAGLHRESVRVPLMRRAAGSVRVTDANQLEIVAPEGDLKAWVEALPATLAGMDLSRVRRAN